MSRTSATSCALVSAVPRSVVPPRPPISSPRRTRTWSSGTPSSVAPSKRKPSMFMPCRLMPCRLMPCRLMPCMLMPGINMQGINMQGINLQGINLQGMNMLGFRFEGATLDGVPLDHVRVLRGELIGGRGGTTLRGTALTNAQLVAEVRDITVTPPATAQVTYRISSIIPEDSRNDPTGTGH